MTTILQSLCEDEATVNFNAIWGQTAGDWELVGQPSALSGEIFSAVIMLIFTDKRAPDDRPLPTEIEDRRGWFGDYVDVRGDLGEVEMGSHLWLYERATMTEDTVKGVRDSIEDCLQPLVDQGVVAEVSVEAEPDRSNSGIHVGVEIFAKTRQRVFEARFTRSWTQILPGLEI